jgi:hypothetical protein
MHTYTECMGYTTSYTETLKMLQYIQCKMKEGKRLHPNVCKVRGFHHNITYVEMRVCAVRCLHACLIFESLCNAFSSCIIVGAARIMRDTIEIPVRIGFLLASAQIQLDFNSWDYVLSTN